MHEFPNMHRRTARKAADNTPERRPPLIIGDKPAPPLLSDALVLAWSLAATLNGAHHQCQRRECRNKKRCRSAAGESKGTLCDVPLPESADKMVIGMLLFVCALAHGKK